MLITQLVFQVTLAPYIEAKLDVVHNSFAWALMLFCAVDPQRLHLAGGDASNGRASAFVAIWHGSLSAFLMPARQIGRPCVCIRACSVKQRATG